MRLSCALMAALLPLQAQTGRFTIHMILHAIGQERYEIQRAADGIVLSTTIEYSDRGNKRSTTATLRMKSDFTPVSVEVKGQTSNSTASVLEGAATVEENGSKRVHLAREVLHHFWGLALRASNGDAALLERSRKAFPPDVAARRRECRRSPDSACRTRQGYGEGKLCNAQSLYNRQSDVRPRDRLDRLAGRSGGSHDICRRLADGGGAH